MDLNKQENHEDKYIIIYLVLARFLPNDVVKYIVFTLYDSEKCPSTLLTRKQCQLLMQWISEALHCRATQIELKNLYTATRDGHTCQDFHRLCDGVTPTVSIIQASDKYVFGGFTRHKWLGGSGNNSRSDTKIQGKNIGEYGFIFTVTNPHDIPMTKYMPDVNNCINSSDTIYNGDRGPTFGYGYDIFCNDNSNSEHTSSHILFPNTYMDTTGFGCSTFTTGQAKDKRVVFRTIEVEVFLITKT